MNTFIIILLIAGFIYLAIFHKPVKTTEDELKAWFSSRLLDIASNLEIDIEKDKSGHYPHAGNHSLKKQGTITYTLLDKEGSRFDVSDKNPISVKSIMTTDAYKQLEQKVRALNLSLTIDEIEVNTSDDDTETRYQEDDEYIDEHYRYFTVTISGW